jgi:hypothetical protein
MRSSTLVVASAFALSAWLGWSGVAEARTVIKNPNEHPDYRAELEPHGNLILWHRYYHRRYRAYNDFGDPEGGLGFRATIELGDPAFVPQINNTVGITFGIDVTSCRYCSDDVTLWFPVGLQWNFFLTDKWSVFADLGVIPRTDGVRDLYFDFMAHVGGRYHFNDTVALTMRIGQPFISVGASFFVGG